MQELIPNELGIWIECCNSACKKWRYTTDIDDPLMVPEKWYCHMNSNKSINDCSIPENVELEEDEVFIESKFKAGCIVWAKVIGHPWSPAMVDFCPEFERYYWFDDLDSNVPTQYHVTFLSGNKITRTWLKDGAIKSFIGNEDPSFVLKARVCGKNLKAKAREHIMKGCEIAHDALRLSISNRLKKYNYNSWRLAQRFYTLPLAGHSGQLASTNGAGPNNAKVSPAGNTKSAKRLFEKPVQSTKTLRENFKKSAPPNVERPSKTVEIKSGKENVDPKQSLLIRKSPLALLNRLANDSPSDETVSINSEKTDTQYMDDTRSINSVALNDSVEFVTVNKERFNTVERQVIERKSDDSLAVGIVRNKRLSKEGITEIFTGASDETIPSSQNSTPRKVSCDTISMIKGAYDEVDMLQDTDGIVTEDPEMVLKSPDDSIPSRLSLMLKSMNEERRKNLRDLGSQKSASENFMRTSNKENIPEESRYLRALSEFTPTEQHSSRIYQATVPAARRPLPAWFSNVRERRQAEAERFDKLLLKMSEKENSRMQKENRENFSAGMETAGPSRVQDIQKRKQRYDYLLTSDEDSF